MMNSSSPRTASAHPDPATSDGDAVLSLHAVGISFRGVRALSDVTLDVPAGGISAVIGPNGAGKTTLFNCISGIYRHEGDVLLDGRSLRRLRRDRRSRAGIARTFQTPSLIEASTVLDNVELGALPWTSSAILGTALTTPRSRREAAEARERADEMISAVGLAARARNMPVAALAHADRRRVEIARALVARPRLLMLDEPAAGLSTAESDELIALVLEHGERTGMTALLVEHDVSLVMRVARWVAVLDAGRVLASGSPQAVRRDPAVIAAYLGAETGEAA